MTGRFYLSTETMDKFFKLRSYGLEMEKLITNMFIIDSGCHPDVPIRVSPVYEDSPEDDPENVCGMHWEQHIDRNALYSKLYPVYDNGMGALMKATFCSN